jgi:hypothetical protein
MTKAETIILLIEVGIIAVAALFFILSRYPRP